LTNITTKQLSLMITQFEAVRLMECSAFVSLMILSVNIGVKALVYFMKKRRKEKTVIVKSNEEVME